MMMNIQDAQRLLAQMRRGYLEELPAKLEDIERQLLDMNAVFTQPLFESIYRAVHNIKGGAGTYGILFISAICHDFEDHLNRMQGAGGRESFEMALAYVDLIRRVAAESQAGSIDIAAAEQKLQQLRRRSLGQLAAGLLVESSAYISLVCQDALRALPVRLTVVDDGLAALERLLHSPFDFLITSREAKTLNGIALIAALRASDGGNRNIRVIMITTGDAADVPAHARPDCTVVKDTSLAVNLASEVAQGLAAAAAVRACTPSST